MNTVVKKTLDNLGVEYILKKHSNGAFSCEDAAREHKIALSQVLKCMVGKNAFGNICVIC